MKIWTCGRITAMRDIGELHGDQGFVMIEDHGAAIARLTKLRALDEQQFQRLKASFDEVVRQRDEYRAALDAMAEDAGSGNGIHTKGATCPEDVVQYYLDKARQAGEGSDEQKA